MMAIAPHEWCRVLRWRAGKTQREVAAELDVSRSWVNQMERGLENCDRLLEYWGTS